MSTAQHPTPAPETWGPLFLAALRTGATPAEAAQAAGVTIEQAQEHKAADAAFRALWLASLPAARTRRGADLAAEVTALGFPATVLGFAPHHPGYWREPGLPWFTQEMYQHPPLGYNGEPTVPFVSQVAGNDMAPRFPKGCAVYTMPVFEKKNLVVGRVYLYRFQTEGSDEWEWNMARLVKIGGNCLHVLADNNPIPTIWLLNENEAEAVWDVREVTHYLSYPAL